MSIQHHQPGEHAGRSATAGRVIAVRGAVIDVDFTGQALPAVDTAMFVSMGTGRQVLVEVQAHVSDAVVRALALQATAGIARGMPVHSTGRPIEAPVGTCVLGRLLDVAGSLCDSEGPLPDDVERRAIHRPPPALSAQHGATRLFSTGITRSASGTRSRRAARIARKPYSVERCDH